MQGRGSGQVRDFALYGETTGETDEFGLPVRYDWAAEYRGRAAVVYGHTPVPEPEWLNRTMNIDTGCVFGGKLTALRWPERELVSVPAARTYCEPVRPFLPVHDPTQAPSAQQIHDQVLDLDDVRGKRIIATCLRGERDDPRGKLRRRPRSHEPVRRRPQVADLSTTHHVAVRDNERRQTCWSIPPLPSTTTAPWRAASHLPGEAHGVASHRDRLLRSCSGERAVRHHNGPARNRLHPHRPPFLERSRPGT